MDAQCAPTKKVNRLSYFFSCLRSLPSAPSYPYKGNGCSKRVALIKSAHGAGKRFSSLRANRRCLPFLSPAVDTANVPTAAAAESSPGNGEPPSQFGHTGKPVPATSAARIGRTVCAIGRSLSILNFDTPPFLCYTKGKKTILE